MLAADSNAEATAEPDADRAPILVVGTGRSGTTLLRLVLNAHPRIYLTHELSFYRVRSGLPAAPSAEQFLERFFRSAAFGLSGLARQAVRAELERERAAGRAGPAAAYRALMRAGARRFGRLRYGDKTPLHALQLEDIFADFPDARVIHLVRDPRATVASLLRMPWAPASTGLNSLFCRRTLEAVRPFRARICELRLEDLLARPEAELRRVLEFVGEAWDAAVLDHASRGPAGDVPPLPWFAAARRPLQPPAEPPAWRAQLGPAWIRNIEQVHRRSMARYGYAPAALEREPSWLERQRARLADAGRVARGLAHRRRLLRITAGDRVADPREVLACLLQWNPAAWARYPDAVLPRLRDVPEVPER